jgi:hypothetical protein
MLEGFGPTRQVGSRLGRSARYYFIGAGVFALVAVRAALLILDPAAAVAKEKSPSEISLGDLAVSGFSGAVLAGGSVPPGSDPNEKTVIDVTGAAVTVFDVSALGGAASGQTITPPIRVSVMAKDIGQVFPLAFDDGVNGGSPNLYAGASSAYGLQIVAGQPGADGKPVRLKAGAAGAKFMDGQFGSLPGASPGAIWKIDGATGKASFLADTGKAGQANSGPGIGGLAYDPVSHTLYASDLDTGLVHRFALDHDAVDLDQFDHGISGRPSRGLAPIADDGSHADITSPNFKPDDPATWGFTQKERRVRALAVHQGRLFYSVDDGPEIWSVGLNADGSFGTDPRSELEVKADKKLPITAIAFDANGDMILAQRGEQAGSYAYGGFIVPSNAVVLRYTPKAPGDTTTPGAWEPTPQTYAVGLGPGNMGASGGASTQYGYTPDGRIDTTACRASLAMTADGVTFSGTGHGAQLSHIDAVQPQDAPATSVFFDFDPKQDSPDLRGHVGAIEAFTRCPDSGGPPALANGAPGSGFPPLGAAPGGLPGGLPPLGGGGGTLPPPLGGGGNAGLPPVAPGEGGIAPPTGGGGTVQQGPLKIAKSGVSANCNAQKQCTYEIDVTNTTNAAVPGPITISDTLSAGNASLANAKITGTPTAGWFCSTDAPQFTCTSQAPIPANATVRLNLSFIPGDIGNAKEVKNCARLAPDQQAELNPNITETLNGLKVELQAGSKSCASGQPCDWKLIATNVGSVPIDGIQMSLFVGAPPAGDGEFEPMTNLVLQSSTPPAGMTCAVKTDDAGMSVVVCTGGPSLAPGASETLDAVTTGSLPADAQVAAAMGIVEGNDGSAEAGSEAVVPLSPPPAGSAAATLPASSEGIGVTSENNAVAVSATTKPRACSNGTCDVVVTAQNFSNVPLQGDVRLTIATTATSNGTTAAPGAVQLISSDPAAGTCSVGADNTISCQGGQMGLPAGGSKDLSFKIKVTPLAGTTPDFFTFKANLAIGAFTGPAGGPPPANVAAEGTTSALPNGGGGGGAGGAAGAGGTAGNAGGAQAQPQQACASIPVIQPTPPHLTIAKTATAGACSDAGGCDFKITVSNDGDTDFDGPVSFDDVVTADNAVLGATQMTNGQAVGDFACSKGAQGFTCVSNGPIKIPAKGSVDHDVSFALGPGSAAKEIENCATLQGSDQPKQCAAIPLVSGPLLRVKKMAQGTNCTPTGAKGESCNFIVLITNVGNAPYTGPLSFTDTFTPNQGGAAAMSSITADEPDVKWSCSQTPDQVSTCTAPNVTIQPGKAVDAAIDLSPLTHNDTYHNCAALIGDAAVGSDHPQDCATINDTTTPPSAGEPPTTPGLDKLQIAKKADDTGCFPNGDCKFTITISNPGPDPFSGPIEVDDVLTGKDGAPLTQATIGSNTVNPWVCQSEGGGHFACRGSVNIPAGGSTSFDVSFAANTTEGQQIQNCALINGGASPQACAVMNVAAPAEQVPVTLLDHPRIGVQEVATTPVCPVAGPCKFTATFTNLGQGTFQGTLAYVGRVDKGVGGSFSTFAAVDKQVLATCTGANVTQLPCSTVNVKLDHDQSVSVDIEVDPGNGWAKGNEVEHCTTLNHDGTTSTIPQDPPTHLGEDFHCAFATLDPFDVNITKTGDQSCKPGSECHFNLDIFDPGPVVHDAPVTVTDNVSGLSGAPVVSITQTSGDDPFPCSPQPSRIPFSCTGHMHLEVGEHDTYSMTIQIPAGAAESTQSWFSNCASVTDPEASAAGSGAGKPDNKAASTVSCAVVTLGNSCTGGMVLGTTGQCECPTGTTWNGTACSVTLCPPGSTGTYPNCSPGSGGAYPSMQPPTTAPNQPIVQPQTPVCPTGMTWNGVACSATVCPPGTSGTYPNCGSGGAYPSMPPTTTPTQPTVPPPTTACPPGTFGTYPNCSTGSGGAYPSRQPGGGCPSGFEYRKGRCRCPYGTRLYRGTCQASAQQNGQPATTVCPPDRPVGTPPYCCPSGYRYSRGMCQPEMQQQQSCPPGTIGRPPFCVSQFQMGGKKKHQQQQPQQQQQTPTQHSCPPGYRVLTSPNKYGAYCEIIPQATPTTPSAPAQQQACPSGQIGTFPNCHCPSGTTGLHCDQVIVR